MLYLTSKLDRVLRNAIEAFDFNTYVRALSDFCNDDLSAFFFDIRKDVLYCEVNPQTGVQTDRRRAYRTVLDTLFHALVRWLSPVLVFTSEEVWQTRYPEAGSVHLLEWPLIEEIEASENDWTELRALRAQVTEAIEPLRREKVVGSSLEAEVTLRALPLAPDRLAELFIVSAVHKGHDVCVTKTKESQMRALLALSPGGQDDGELCRCKDVLNG